MPIYGSAGHETPREWMDRKEEKRPEGLSVIFPPCSYLKVMSARIEVQSVCSEWVPVKP